MILYDNPSERKMFVIGKKNIVLMLVVFLFSMTFTQFLFQNLPFQIFLFDDLLEHGKASRVSVTDLARHMFVRYFGITVSEVSSPHLEDRTFKFFVYKFLAVLFPYDPFYYYLFKSFILAVIAVEIFVFIYYVTENSWFSLAGSILYTVLPSVISSTMWFAAFELVAEFFMLLALILVLWYTMQKTSMRMTVFIQGAVFVMSLIAMKTKESAKLVLPLVVLLLFLFKRNELVAWVPYMVAMTWLSLPQTMYSSVTTIDFHYIVDHVAGWVYRYPGGDSTAEHASIMWSPHEGLVAAAGSLVSQTGFVLLWALATLGVVNIFLGSKKHVLSGQRKLLVYFFVVWFLLSLLMISTLNFSLRYLSMTSIPFVILLAALTWRQYVAFPNKKICGVVLLLAFLPTFAVHVYQSTQSVRGGNGGLWIVSFNGMKTIAQLQCNCTVSDKEFYLTYVNKTFSDFKQVLVDFPLYGINTNKLEDIPVNGTFYYFAISSNNELPSKIANVSIITGEYPVQGEVPGVYSSLKALMKERKPRAVIWQLKKVRDGP